MESEGRTENTGTWLWRAYCAVGIILLFVYRLPLPGHLGALIYDSFGVAAVVATAVGLRRHRPASSWAWWLLCAGFAALSIGDLIWEFYELVLGRLSPFPSVADACYLGGYPIGAAGLVGFGLARGRGSDRGRIIDAAIIGISYGVAAWFFFLEPYLRDPSYSVFERLVSAAYPAMDTLLVAGAALLLLTPGRRSSSYLMLIAGTATYVTADIFYAREILAGTYVDGSWLDSLWMFATLLWGVAALHPSMRNVGRVGPVLEVTLSRPRLALLAGAALAVPALQTLETGHDDRADLFVALGATALIFLLVIVRLHGLVHAVGRGRRYFRALAEHGADLMAVLGPDAVIHYASPSYRAVLGYGEDDLMGYDGLTLIDPADLPVMQEVLGCLLAEPGGKHVVEVRVRHADGSSRMLEAIGTSLLHDPDVRGIVFNARDVTTRMQAEAALRASEEQFRLLFAANPHPTAVYDAETHRFLEVNAAAIEHYGYTREQFLAMTIWDVCPPEEEAHLRAVISQDPPAPEHQEVWKHRLSNGRLVDVEVTSHALTFRDRPAVLVVAQDVTERMALQAQLAHQAFHDPLTALPNRALFLDRLGHALARRGARPDSVATLFLDLDDFKVINDTLGHEAGDELLTVVAERLRGCVRPGDTVARLGGDEFTILLEGLDGAEGARKIADRVSKALKTPVTVAGHDIFVTFSIGIATPTTIDDRAEDLLRAADAAMYEAKQKGKARYALFDPRMEARAWARLRLEADLRQALAGDQLRLFYQPLVDLESGRIAEVEALVRWEHPTRGSMSPAEFIPVAEESGLIIVLGQWVLEQACRQVRYWQRSNPEIADLVVAVNLSVRQFQHPTLFADVARILDETGLAPGCLKLEITESAAIADAEAATATLRALKDFGVRLAIDDFGTGYAGLSYLRSCPVDALKIDRTFIAGLGRDPEDVAMIRAVLGLAETLGLDVTAEGIETQAQLDQLRAMGCAHGQGYLFAEPQPPEVMAEFLMSETPGRRFASHGAVMRGIAAVV
jgi:diguanylate cyclase (GGDEF)-like protein/PAS domain S-box-containing protein